MQTAKSHTLIFSLVGMCHCISCKNIVFFSLSHVATEMMMLTWPN